MYLKYKKSKSSQCIMFPFRLLNYGDLQIIWTQSIIVCNKILKQK